MKKFFVVIELFNTNVVNNYNTSNPLQKTNYILVNDFLNKTVSLESLIKSVSKYYLFQLVLEKLSIYCFLILLPPHHIIFFYFSIIRKNT